MRVASDVADAVEGWKTKRTPPMIRDEIMNAIMTVATQDWIEVLPEIL